MTVTFDLTTVLNYYEAKEGVSLSGSSTTSGTSAAPTAPWNVTTSSSASTATTSASQKAATALNKANTLAESILVDGTKLIDPTSAKLDVSTSNTSANSDYKNLFALYQGLTSLQSLATAAGTAGVATASLAQLQKAFSNGLSQVQSFITDNPFKEFEVGDGTVAARDQTTIGPHQESDTYTTGLTATSANAVVPQLQGDVQFSMSVQPFHQAAQTIDFNLNDMGSTPRTLANVVTYMNGQLAAAGVKTRFADQLVSAGTTAMAAVAATLTSTGTSATSTTLPQFALTLKGSALESVSFSAADAAPAVYVAQTSTEPVLASGPTSASSTTSTTSTTTASTTPVTASQVLALDPSGQHATAVGAKLWTDNLPADATVQATATAADGSVYVLANVTGSANGQAIQGARDAALMKYDSAGSLVYTRTLGAASSASGYALAVSRDGGQVAVAGTATGTLDPTDTADAGSTTSQSFVTTYNTSTGDELWTQSQNADVDNQASGVAFGSDNTVYVTGSVQGSLRPGALSSVTQQGYLQSYTAHATTDPATGEATWQAVPTSTTQFGASGINRATGVAVNGTSVYVSSVENGEAVVREYDASSPHAPTLAAEQDLGSVNGGGLNAIALGADGSVYVAGATHNAALNAGTVTNAYAGNGDAFVAKLSSDLDPSSGESIAYLNNGGATTATALAVSGNQAYITGQTATGASPYGSALSETGYAAELDPTSGAVGWNQSFKGLEGNAAPVAIAVGATGSSSLSAMGLPGGTIAYTSSNTLVANTSLRAGDQFSVQVGSGVATKITIAADETYTSLAAKIAHASGYRVNATTVTDGNDEQELKLTPSSTSTQTQVSIQAGPIGRDALASIGLKAGLITNASTLKAAKGVSATSSLKAAYTVNVPTTLNLNSATDIAAAKTQISTAMAEIQSIYRNMTTPKSTTAASSSSANSAALVKFYNAQASDYATALARLGG